MITTLMAGFAFGYCIADIIISYRANKRLNEMLKDLTENKE